MHRSWLVFGVLVLAACSGGSSAKTQSSVPPPTSPAPTTTTTRPPTTSTSKSTSTSSTTKPPTAADLAAVRIALTPVAGGLDSPVAVAWRANDARMFVAEQGGRIRTVDATGNVSPTPLVTVGPLSRGNEQGLLGLTFSPDGSKLYVHYTDPGMDVHIDEYTMQGQNAVAASRRQVMFVEHPYSNHNGGQVLTGPDGMLYIALGDGGGAGDPKRNGQNLGSPLAKILRINPAPKGGAPYSVPADNPFVGQAGARPETWMWGLRNAWRFTFDRATGDMWIGDVGQNAYEEIDVARAGEKGINWGWNAREGFHAFAGGTPSGARDPLLETSHNAGNCAIVGGYVYRGKAIPALNGVYVFGDNCRTDLVGVVAAGGRVVAQRDLGQSVPQLTSFGEGPDGEIYGLARTGTVFRLTPG